MKRTHAARNICHDITKACQNGKRLNTHPFSPNIVELVDERSEFKGLSRLMFALDVSSTANDFNVENCITVIKELSRVLEEANLKDDHVETTASLCRLVEDLRGPEIIIRILCHKDEYGFDNLDPSLRPTEERLQSLQSQALDLLQNVNYCSNILSKTLGLNDHFINQLFSFLKGKETYVYASQLLDDILRSRKELVSLNNIKHLPDLITAMSDHQLANFCRVLYFVLADTEAGEDRNTILINQDTNTRLQKKASIADDNQGILVSIPEFLPRVSNLASELIGRSPNTRLHQLTTFFSGVLDNINDRDNDDSSSILHSPLFPLSLKFFQDIMLKVEALFVLCVLLTGKHKTKVQESLAELRLIPKLCVFFDELTWNDNHVSYSDMSLNDDYNFAQETALEIQFLRLIHSFCDHHEKKYLLLTPVEQNELKTIYEQNNCPVPDGIINCDQTLCCEGEKGLLTKTLEALKKSSKNSTLRFWFSRAIEGFLRGRASYADQIFLINRGLLRLLLDHICSKDLKTKEVLQSSFDLLGELMKFNHVAFQEFNTNITEAQFDHFIMVMTSNVVDSNMFMRCLILSFEHFSLQRDCSASSRLTAFISNWKQRVYLLHKLIMSVTVETLTQENVSCLNTSLIFLMFALDKGYLPCYLKAFRAEETALKQPGFILNNLRSLLNFWKLHYLSRGKDCSALEQSSCINFQQWKTAVDILLQEDITNPKAVVHYISGKMDRTC